MKILILSNNPLSLSNSNGRTMLNMLGKFNNKEILNIFINGNNCALEKAIFYKINENNLYKFSKKIGNYVSINQNVSFVSRKKKRTPFKLIIRSIFWNSKKLFKEIVSVSNSFKPDCILIQCGDSDFLINLACNLSKKLNVQLFSFNSEDYIFKTWNYLDSTKKMTFLYKIFFKKLLKSYDCLYRNVRSSIYLTEDLKNLYKTKYLDDEGYYIYNSSSLKKVEHLNGDGDIIYSGNIGVGRSKTLIDISKIIYEILGKKLIIYSQTNDNEIIKKINKESSILFKGSISYDENINQIKNSSIVFHCESFDDFYLKDTKHSFSTKIADCLTIGVPFVVIAPNDSTIYNYINKYDCAFTFNNYDDFASFLTKVKQNKDILKSKLENGYIVAMKNHNASINSKTFYEIIERGIRQ